MVERNEADKTPFLLKKDLKGNIIRTRVSGLSGGELLGSIQQTNAGLSYLVAGSGMTIVSSSNGQITFTSTGGSSTSYFAGNIQVQGTGSFVQGISGSLTRLTNGTSYLVAGSNITISSSSNGQITISSTATGGGSTFDATASYVVLSATSSLANERVLTSSTGISLTDGGAGSTITIGFRDNIIATLTGSLFSGNIRVAGTGSFIQGISGSLTRLVDGTSYITAGSNITVASASNGQITISSTAAGSVFDATASYVVLSATSSLANERVLTSSTGISITDGGAGSNVTVGFLDSIIATVSGTTFTGPISATTASFTLGMSGSLTRLVDGTPYIVAGNNVSVSSASNGAITISTAATLTAQTAYNIIPSPNNISGTIETIIGAVYITSATFSSGRAMMGSEFSGDTTTLRMRRFSTGDIILVLTGAGLLSDVVSTGSVIIPANDWYNVSISNSSVSGSAICQGFKIIV